uniref:EP1-like protein n=1 Tax=Glyptapanteles indiensis TaxID=92994 RepID=B7S922_GLYIN|nr:EP1-like protein [Glyptapanteles indiensis]
MFGKLLVVVLALCIGISMVEARRNRPHLRSIECTKEILPVFESEYILIESLKTPCMMKATTVNLTDTIIFMNDTSLHIIAHRVILGNSQFYGNNFSISIVADSVLLDGNRFNGNHQNFDILGSSVVIARNTFGGDDSNYKVKGLYFFEEHNMFVGENQNHIRKEVTSEQIRNEHPEELPTYKTLDLNFVKMDSNTFAFEFNLIRSHNLYDGSSQTHLLRAAKIKETLNMYNGLPQTHEAFGTNVVSDLNMYPGPVTHRINGVDQKDWGAI